MNDAQASCAGGPGDANWPASAEAMPQADITILLSTYNGEKYLARQLESFVEQRDVSWRLAWRDDGSSDATIAIMEEFCGRAGMRCVQSASSGRHLGAALSFLTLLRENEDASFIAFSDQDDCWLPGKLQRSLQLLGDADGDGEGEGEGVPALYCARQILTEADFSHPTPSMKFKGSPGFPASLTQNAATGSTVVMNRKAARLVGTIPLPVASTHDWWSYIVVSAHGGEVIYDAQPSMLYRQHAQNMIGSPMRPISRAIAALHRGPKIYMTMMRRHTEQLYAYRHFLPALTVLDLELIRNGLQGGYADRIQALRCKAFRRATTLETLLFRFWFLMF